MQHISVLQSENQAHIANISAGAEAKSKEIKAAARRDAFNLKQGMKAKKLLGGLKQRVLFLFLCGWGVSLKDHNVWKINYAVFSLAKYWSEITNLLKLIEYCRCRSSARVRYAELRSALELSPTQMSEYFKVKSVQGQSSQGKVRKNRKSPAIFFLGKGKETWKIVP